MSKLTAKAIRVLDVLISLLVLLLAVLLAAAVLSAYVVGSGSANRTEEGVLIRQIFSRDGAIKAMMRCLPLFALLAVLIAADAILRAGKPGVKPLLLPGKKSHSDRSGTKSGGNPAPGHGGQNQPFLPACRKAMAIRTVLLAVAAVLILAGILNGGVRDVLIKAINICTECIGLG